MIFQGNSSQDFCPDLKLFFRSTTIIPTSTSKPNPPDINYNFYVHLKSTEQRRYLLNIAKVYVKLCK